MAHSQFTQSRNFRLPALARKAQRLALWVWQFSMTMIAMPLVIVCRLLKPWRHIRFGFFIADRIGHFAFDVEYYLSERSESSKQNETIDLFFFERLPANAQLALMCRRQIVINPLVRFLYRANRLVPGGGNYQIVPARHLTDSRDKVGTLARTSTRLLFTPREIIRGEAYLEQLGCCDPKKVICLIVRDSAYLADTQADRDWSHHNFRDTNIDDYCQVAQTLAEKGYWVLRMGKKVHRSLKVNHPRVIDYACSLDRCDFLDVWLLANCFFTISTGLGLDSVADMFRRPQVFVNYLPLMDMEAWGRYLTVPKILSWAVSGRPLTLAEQAAHSSVNTFYYQEKGITIQDLSPIEINDAVLEFEERLTGKWEMGDDEVALHNRFWETLRACPEFNSYHGWIHPEARVGTKYLREAQAYLFA